MFGLRKRVKALEIKVQQLECTHKGNRDYKKTKTSRYYGTHEYGTWIDVYKFPMRETCSLCDKELKTYSEEAWKKKELKIAEDKVKELKRRK